MKSLSRKAEDYLRCLYGIVERKGYARIKNIARGMRVAPSSAVEMMSKLDGMGLVAYEKRGAVTLTPKGKDVAMAIKERHETFSKFLQIILVPKKIALKDAHILEHQLDPKTVVQFKRFVEFITSAPERPRFVERWMEQFRRYCERETSRAQAYNPNEN